MLESLDILNYCNSNDIDKLFDDKAMSESTPPYTGCESAEILRGKWLLCSVNRFFVIIKTIIQIISYRPNKPISRCK